MKFEIRRLSYALGAEIIGVDIRQPMSEELFKSVYAEFLTHGILLFRGQPLTREQHVAFSRLFGEVDTNTRDGYSSTKQASEHPEILINKAAPRKQSGSIGVDFLSSIQGNYWHSDRVHRTSPDKATLLRAVEIPKVGGDTLFANMYLAYETLSNGMKKMIQELFCVHPGATHEFKQTDPPVAQPLVRVHPETSRKSLYLTEKVKKFVGMTEEESKPLVHFLCQHAGRAPFVYRHVWQKNDLVIWDNRCMWHNAVGDYDRSETRHMERTTVLGTPSGGYVYEEKVASAS